MAITQISVFVESRPGHLVRTLSVFSEAGINVRDFSAGDTGEYGIVRFIVDKPDQALALLAERGAAARASEVLCVLGGLILRFCLVLAGSHWLG